MSVKYGLSVSFRSLFQLVAKKAHNDHKKLDLTLYRDPDDNGLWKVHSQWKPLDDLSHKDLDGLLLILAGLLVLPGEEPKITYRPSESTEHQALPNSPE